MSDVQRSAEETDATLTSLQRSQVIEQQADALTEQETQFGSTVERIMSTSQEESNDITSAVAITTPVQQRPLRHVHMQDREEADEETEREKREHMDLVSKQSRPFLLFKIMQWGFSAMILALTLTTWPVMLLRGNIHVAMQPLVAFVTFIIYCPIVFFGYTFHLNTPAAVMLALDALGAVYFTFAAIMFGVYWADLESLLTQSPPGSPPVTELEQIKMALEAIGMQPDVHICADRILMQCLLTCSAATTFIVDVFLTLKYLVLRRIPLIGKHRMSVWPI